MAASSNLAHPCTRQDKIPHPPTIIAQPRRKQAPAKATLRMLYNSSIFQYLCDLRSLSFLYGKKWRGEARKVPQATMKIEKLNPPLFRFGHTVCHKVLCVMYMYMHAQVRIWYVRYKISSHITVRLHVKQSDYMRKVLLTRNKTVARIDESYLQSSLMMTDSPQIRVKGYIYAKRIKLSHEPQRGFTDVVYSKLATAKP